MKRLVFMVEGPGDFQAVPSLAGRLLTQMLVEFQSALFLDSQPFMIGGLEQVSGERKRSEWNRYLKAVQKTRSNLGAVLAVFDGDSYQFEKQPFCAIHAARTLAGRATQEGAGSLFSLGVVFLRQEYESILIAAGRQIPGMPEDVAFPSTLEEAPRDAKGWLDDHLPEGYDPKRDQRQLTTVVQDWQPVRDSHRSFKRFENTLRELAAAVRSEVHIVTPSTPASPSNK